MPLLGGKSGIYIWLFSCQGKIQEHKENKEFYVSVATVNKSKPCTHGSGESYLVSTVISIELCLRGRIFS